MKVPISGSRKPPVCSGRGSAAGAGRQLQARGTGRPRTTCRATIAPAIRQRAMPAAQAAATASRSTPPRRRRPAAARSGSTGSRGSGSPGVRRADRRCHRRPCRREYLRSERRANQPANERNALETSRTAANAYIVCPNGFTERPSALSTIVAASGPRGLEEEDQAVERVRREPDRPVTIESMIASPSARAAASTAAATIAGRAARTPIVHSARARLTPSAAAPSVQTAAPSQRVDDDRDHDRRDHHRQHEDPDADARAVELDHVLDRFLALLGDEVVVEERDEDEDPDQPVDDRRHRGEQPHDRLEDPPDPLGRELDDEGRREQGDDRSPSTTETPVIRKSRRSAARRAGGRRSRPGSAGELKMSVELLVDVAAGAEPGEAVVGERRPRLREDEDDHPRDQQQDRARQRAEQKLGAPVRSAAAVCAPPESSAGRSTQLERDPLGGDDLRRVLRLCDPLDELLGAPAGAPRVTM